MPFEPVTVTLCAVPAGSGQTVCPVMGLSCHWPGPSASPATHDVGMSGAGGAGGADGGGANGGGGGSHSSGYTQTFHAAITPD